MFLTINQVNKQYENQGIVNQVLSDINVTINEGEFVSILGPSGCGKSTLLSMVAGLNKPTSGEISLQGNPIKKPGKDRGMVFQQPALFPWMSVEENVMFPLRKEMSKSQAREVAHGFLKMVQLSNYTKHSPHELSGGMQQRVAIARALAMNPEVLLMDEPFGALDEQTRSRLHVELEKIWLETKKTILFVTHSIQESIKLSDRILVMGTRPGVILEDIKVDLPRPRSNSREQAIELEKRILGLLEKEIEKVVKEELEYASSN
ncbi:ABC transporter ATP-binding protein [Bacillus luteolus]|uniref:ABC transporter ATP-binding protein n=1 Tax=Litchfieldia luteola TaxID=682179 RepID=A0ABR9QM18_9BACI|nr:ABC transporter ATP-binding protein [Cytobacillus luteolus]MBE4909451.1 ABC transporter ATP-binding protein [Cytobacillus luteolus]MBP1940851.1 NitT/TauT family transport system ATP-binding protein [Cytobacillus luteolus]